MRRNLLTILVLATVITAGGCGDNHEKLVKDLLATENEFVAILETIKTPADVEKNRAELEKLADRFKEIRDRLKKLGEPDDARVEALEKQYGSEFEKIEDRLHKLDKPLSNPDIVGKLEMIFADVNKTLFKGSLHLGINPNKMPNLR